MTTHVQLVSNANYCHYTMIWHYTKAIPRKIYLHCFLLVFALFEFQSSRFEDLKYLQDPKTNRFSGPITGGTFEKRDLDLEMFLVQCSLKSKRSTATRSQSQRLMRRRSDHRNYRRCLKCYYYVDNNDVMVDILSKKETT